MSYTRLEGGATGCWGRLFKSAPPISIELSPGLFKETALPYLHPKIDPHHLKQGALITPSERDFVMQWFDEHPDQVICKELKRLNNDFNEFIRDSYNILRDPLTQTCWAVYPGINKRKHIGSGAQATLKLAQNIETLEWVAIKTGNKRTDIGLNYADREINKEYLNLKAANFDVHLIGKYLVIPLFEGEDFSFYHQRHIFNSLDDLIRLEITLNLLLEVIHRLQKNKIIHRDIKLDNILLHFSKVTLIDFGLSIFTDDINDEDRFKDLCGTRGYVHPSLYKYNDVKPYGEKTDVFGLMFCIAAIFSKLTFNTAEDPEINSDPVSEFVDQKVTPLLRKWNGSSLEKLPTFDELINIFVDLRKNYIATLEPDRSSLHMNKIGFLSIMEYFEADAGTKVAIEESFRTFTQVILINTNPQQVNNHVLLKARKELEKTWIRLSSRVIVATENKPITEIVAQLPAYLERYLPSPLTAYAWITVQPTQILDKNKEVKIFNPSDPRSDTEFHAFCTLSAKNIVQANRPSHVSCCVIV